MELRKLTQMAMLSAVGVLGSMFIWLPVGVAKAFPVQHAINVLSAVLFGPIGAGAVALVTAMIRILTGTGSLLAIPGSVVGAVVAGLLYRYTRRIGMAAVGEFIGTGVIASLVAVPYAAVFMATQVGAFFFMPGFMASSAVGAILGVVIWRFLERSKIAVPERSF
ncbi:energy coupling factor transporter S component ThiW [Chryseomicrobium sp. FSL W7-1435]|uniref:energy coupling factor transporter S component ThiW n=1 Tax=Chryseomicrobium sp. FSL W7-1435 TaxID=2921704 RepID=UPI00315B2B28